MSNPKSLATLGSECMRSHVFSDIKRLPPSFPLLAMKAPIFAMPLAEHRPLTEGISPRKRSMSSYRGTLVSKTDAGYRPPFYLQSFIYE